MKSDQNISILVVKNNAVEDVSEGTLALNFQNGVDSYEGLWQRPDVGQLVLVTRNPQLDPNVNPDVRFNTKIIIDGLFEGYITDINVEYRPKGLPAIITINAIDIVGLAQRHLWTEEFAAYCKTYVASPSFSGKTNAMTLTDLSLALLGYKDSTGKDEIPNFEIYTREWLDSLDGVLYSYDNTASTTITAGENAWDTITKLSQSNLSNMAFWSGNAIIDEPYTKYSPRLYEGLPTTYQYLFSSEGDGLSYKSIKIDDGFGRTVNQVKVTNDNITFVGAVDTKVSNTYGPYLSETSINDWGSSELTLETMLSGVDDVETTYERLSRDVLESSANPKLIVKEITFDGNKYPEAAFTAQSLYYYQGIKIKHKVNDSIMIEKIYNVVGAKNEITESDWYVTLILKESTEYLAAEKTYSQPIISINGTYDPEVEINTGDSNFMWSASISNFPIEQIESVAWNFYTTQSGAMGSMLIGGETHSTSLTPTWNYDYPNSYGLSEYEAGAGYKTIRLTITTVDGWKVCAFVDILVTAAQPHADFSYTKDANGGFTFTDLSYDAQFWTWDFGDGTTSSLQFPPKKYYSASGTYTTTLTVSNGVASDSKSVTYTLTSELIPVRYIKFDIKGTRNRANSSSPWDKNIIKSIYKAYGTATPDPFYGGFGEGLSPQGITEIVVNKGSVTNQSGQSLSGLVNSSTGTFNTEISYQLYQPINTRYVTCNPLVTNGGNTEEYDMSFIFDISKYLSNMNIQASTPGMPEDYSYWSYVPSGTSYTYPTKFHYHDTFIIPRSWTTNTHYEPINVYVSSDKVNWVKTGDINVYRTTYPPSGSYVAWTLDNKIPMPPRFVG